jgi:hypothetical protein
MNHFLLLRLSLHRDGCHVFATTEYYSYFDSYVVLTLTFHVYPAASIQSSFGKD